MPTQKLRELELMALKWTVTKLRFDNVLEGSLCFMASWWGGWTAMYPIFWSAYPTGHVMVEAQTLGHPELVSYLLIACGVGGYAGMKFRSNALRSVSSSVAMVLWALLAVDWSLRQQAFAASAAVYSAFALGELLCLVKSHLEAYGLLRPRETEEDFLRSQLNDD
jgi:hypothetical protein